MGRQWTQNHEGRVRGGDRRRESCGDREDLAERQREWVASVKQGGGSSSETHPRRAEPKMEKTKVQTPQKEGREAQVTKPGAGTSCHPSSLWGPKECHLPLLRATNVTVLSQGHVSRGSLAEHVPGMGRASVEMSRLSRQGLVPSCVLQV